MIRPSSVPLWLISAALVAMACTSQARRLVELRQAPKPASGSTLKAHLRSGEMIAFAQWFETDSTISGYGTRYGPDRRRLAADEWAVPLDSVALLELDTRETHVGAGVGGTIMGLFTVLMTAVTAQCVADPKSCFGSCPTFYLAGDSDRPAAEGFSSSIARVLEARDIDALYGARPTDRRFALRMTNEALETHAVRYARLLAVRRPTNGRVYASRDGRFYPATQLLAPTGCRSPLGDCRAALGALDGIEWKSVTDAADLAAREVLELEFPPVDGQLGIVIGARQSFVSTYVFYQTMAYLGRGAGSWLARLETEGPETARQAMAMAHVLGEIHAEVQTADGTWRPAGSYDEAGPIATDVSVIPIGDGHRGPVRLRLSLNKGGWRVDYVALARLAPPVIPEVIPPDLVERGNRPDATALGLLRAADRYLITYPGDEYRLWYTLPDHPQNLELFLDSQGYYYEWMRAEWLAEENPILAAQAFLDPRGTLKRLAPAFKRVEPQMEHLFWQSRFGRRQ